MVYYTSYEQWEDTEDPSFEISMTPEGYPFPEFEDRSSFWRWYADDENCPNFQTYEEFMVWHRLKLGY